MDESFLRTHVPARWRIPGSLGCALFAVLVATPAFAVEPEPVNPPDVVESEGDAAAEVPAAPPRDAASEERAAEEEAQAAVVADDGAGGFPAERPADGSEEDLSQGAPSEHATEAPALAAPIEERQSMMPEIHGFVSQGFIKSSQHNYLAQSERGSFEFAEVGLNFTKQISERLRVGMQLFMRDLGPIGNYKPQFDWFYLDYSFFDWLGLRAGRTKIPFGLYNEINDIDSARVPILLPQSVYPTQNRDYLLAQTGLELYGRVPLSALGDLEYRTYGGTIFFEEDSSEIAELDIPYVIGGRLMWETPLEGLRAGGTLQALSLDGDYVLPPAAVQGYQEQGILPADSSGIIPFRIPAVLWVTSLEYAIHDFQFAAEYSRWNVRIRSDYPEIVPPSETTNERFYLMASHRVAPWFTPGAYYSVFFPDVEERKGREAQWHDLAVTMRFDLTDYWLFKLEGHYMEGTAGLRSSLNDNTALTDLSSTWGLLLAKTTAYF